ILNEITEEEYECDLVSTRLVKLLQDNEFELSTDFFQKIHKGLFNKIYGFAGKYRQVNISKSEDILKGDTVQYQSYDLIEKTLKYDFNEEKEIDYSSFSEEGLIDRITEFTSRIWQVHPFQEGNTRTTAVFIQKYLISMGFNINNELFKDNALYFRNALVRANYTNYSVGVKETKKYLIMFFENLLLNKNSVFSNDDLKI
ncbi:MAG: Fic family protein, partial [Bacilli bacterium]|nr:Fic family protein [Bacilli bacterium]